MKGIRYLIYLIIYASALSCSAGHSGDGNASLMEFASYVSLNEGGAVIANPWKSGSMLQGYSFSTGETGSYRYRPGVMNDVHVPLRRIVVMTNSVARLVDELGLASSIAGVCDAQYIRNPEVVSRLSDGRIADCGDGMNPDIEKIMDLQPDAIFVSPFENAGYGQLEKLGVPLIECAEYMETSPLGRAEWMRFYGRLLGAGSEADSLFAVVRDSYMQLKSVADSVSFRPSVMVDTRSGSAWYTPGGNSTIGTMISDAGGAYVFSDLENSGSVPLSFETVYDRAIDSDVWLLKSRGGQCLTYALLESDFQGYAGFRPYREKNIWVCNVDSVPYFELTSFHPDRLLLDMVSIFHPELQAGAPSFYSPMRE